MTALLALLLTALDEPRTPLDDFKAAVREAKSPDEKSRLLLAFGTSTSPDPAAVAEISRFLTPAPGDLRFVLPTTAAAVLGRLRGNKAASQALERALPAYQKVPCLQRQLIAALARVGHESALPALDAILRGSDLELALFTVGTLPDLPADLSLDAVFRTWDWMESRRPKVGEPVKNAFNRLDAEMLKRVQGMSGETYPSMTEMRRWWSKHAGIWKARARLRERERAPEELPQELPPALLLEFGFNERTGATTANTGVTSAWAPSGLLTRNRPAWSSDTPPSGGTGALDWGPEPGANAVDVGGVAEHLRNLPAFTVTGWINCRSAVEGKGGNRLVTWLDRDGVEIVLRADGSLQVGINQRAEESDVRTAPGLVKVIDKLFDGWHFFAVTFDGTEIRIYVGSRDRDAAPAASGESKHGKVGPRIAANLTIGHVPAPLRGALPGGGFRGLIDEIRIFGGALSPAALAKVQGRP